MAELTLTVPASHPAFASILALLSGTAAIAVAGGAPAPLAPPAPLIPPMPSVNGNGESGDDDGPVNAAAPTVDSTGLPWDERIHAKTKATNTDGSWRKKRGIDDASVASVEAELRAKLAAGAPPAPVPAPLAPPAPIAAPLAPPAPIPAPPAPIMPPPPPMVAPVAPPAPLAPPPPPAPAPVQAAVDQATGALDFHGFMQHLSAQMTKRDATGAPLIHADYLAQITAEISAAFAPHGIAPIAAITDIASSPQMITYAVQLLQRDQRW